MTNLEVEWSLWSVLMYSLWLTGLKLTLFSYYQAWSPAQQYSFTTRPWAWFSPGAMLPVAHFTLLFILPCDLAVACISIQSALFALDQGCCFGRFKVSWLEMGVWSGIYYWNYWGGGGGRLDLIPVFGNIAVMCLVIKWSLKEDENFFCMTCLC